MLGKNYIAKLIALAFLCLTFSSLQAQKKQEQLASFSKSFDSAIVISVDTAIKINKKIQRLAEKESYPDALFTSKLNQARIFDVKTKTNKADSTYRWLLSEYKDEPKFLALTYIKQGQFFQSNMQLDLALTSYIQALKNSELCKDQNLIARSYNLLGIFNSEFGDSTAAMEYLDKAKTIAENLNDLELKLIVYTSIANRYFATNQYEKSLERHLQIQKLLIKSNNSSEIASGYSNIGACYAQMNELDSALVYFDKATKLFERTKQLYNHALTKYNMGVLSIFSNKHKQAANYFSDSREISDGNFPELYLDATKGLAQAENTLGNHQLAYKYLSKAQQFGDSLLNAQLVEQLAEMNVRYESDKKAKEIEILSLKNATQERRQQSLLIITFLVLFALIISIILYINNRNKTAQITREKKRSDELLLNILPYETAEELKSTGFTKAKRFEEVTVLFSDIKNFTSYGEKLGAEELVKELNYCFSAFDQILENYKVEKIKTVGDAYICAGGLPVDYENSVVETIHVAIAMQDFMKKYSAERQKEKKPYFEIRIGLHTGPVVAGIVGIKKFAYDIWGDTVNIAARMEQNCEVGRINVSSATQEKLKAKFNFENRGKVEVKGKGSLEMFYLVYK